MKAGTALGKLVLQRSFSATLHKVKTVNEALPSMLAVTQKAVPGLEASSAGSSTNVPLPELTADQKLRLKATSFRHLALHKPKNKYCEFCVKLNFPRKQAIKGDAEATTGHTEFAQLVLGDHIILRKELEIAAMGEKVALALMDSATGWGDVLPCKTESTEDSLEAFVEFKGTAEAK